MLPPVDVDNGEYAAGEEERERRERHRQDRHPSRRPSGSPIGGPDHAEDEDERWKHHRGQLPVPVERGVGEDAESGAGGHGRLADRPGSRLAPDRDPPGDQADRHEQQEGETHEAGLGQRLEVEVVGVDDLDVLGTPLVPPEAEVTRPGARDACRPPFGSRDLPDAPAVGPAGGQIGAGPRALERPRLTGELVRGLRHDVRVAACRRPDDESHDRASSSDGHEGGTGPAPGVRSEQRDTLHRQGAEDGGRETGAQDGKCDPVAGGRVRREDARDLDETVLSGREPDEHGCRRCTGGHRRHRLEPARSQREDDDAPNEHDQRAAARERHGKRQHEGRNRGGSGRPDERRARRRTGRPNREHDAETGRGAEPVPVRQRP